MLARVNRLTQATNRPPAWICKYYQAVLSTKVLHSSSRSEICFRGKPNKMVVRKSFEVFLDLYVYCENCGKHDTAYHVSCARLYRVPCARRHHAPVDSETSTKTTRPAELWGGDNPCAMPIAMDFSFLPRNAKKRVKPRRGLQSRTYPDPEFLALRVRQGARHRSKPLLRDILGYVSSSAMNPIVYNADDG